MKKGSIQVYSFFTADSLEHEDFKVKFENRSIDSLKPILEKEEKKKSKQLTS